MIKKKEGKEIKIAYLEITSWAGISFGAIHYYGRLTFEGNDIRVEKELTREGAAALNKQEKYKTYKVGDKTERLDSKDEVIRLAVSCYKSLFPKANLLVEGTTGVWGPQLVLDGPPLLKKKINELVKKAEQINWRNYKDGREKLEKITKEWLHLLKKE